MLPTETYTNARLDHLGIQKAGTVVALSLMMVLWRYGLLARRTSTTDTVSRNKANDSQSDQQANHDFYHAALVFQCFEGIELLHVHAALIPSIDLRVQPLHAPILALPALLHFAAEMEASQQEARAQLGELAVGLIGWAWQRRAILGEQPKQLLDAMDPAWESTRASC